MGSLKQEMSHGVLPEAAMCWTNNMFDLINLANALYWGHNSWFVDPSAPSHYWGWNEVPIDREAITNQDNWDAVVIKLPIGVCGGNGQCADTEPSPVSSI